MIFIEMMLELVMDMEVDKVADEVADMEVDMEVDWHGVEGMKKLWEMKTKRQCKGMVWNKKKWRETKRNDEKQKEMTRNKKKWLEAISHDVSPVAMFKFDLIIIWRMSERLYLGIGVSKPELGKQPILSRVIGRPNLQIKIVQT